MRTRLLCLLAVPALILGFAAGGAWGQDKGNPQEEKALLKNAESFVNAFHKGDAKALAAHWTTDGDYTDQTGKMLKGRAAIEKAFMGLFAENKGLKLRIDITGVRFVTPDVAIEDGVTSVMPADGAPPSRARYTIVHVKRDGEWMLSSVRDSAYAPPTNHEHLASLEWLIGSWADENDKGEVARVTYGWSENQNFILSDFTTTFKNIAIGGGTQRIGYDAATKQIRSWTFENGGGFGDGIWMQNGNKVTIKASATLKDGKKMAATNVLTRVDADTMTFQSGERTLDGMAIPDVKPFTMKRAK
jgi:uncharacterized protein (TIGR02246 family)